MKLLTDSDGILKIYNKLVRLRKELVPFPIIEPSTDAFRFILKLERVFQKLTFPYQELSHTEVQSAFYNILGMHISLE